MYAFDSVWADTPTGTPPEPRPSFAKGPDESWAAFRARLNANLPRLRKNVVEDDPVAVYLGYRRKGQS